MCYQTLEEAILLEGVSSRQELVDKLSSRFSTCATMLDSDLLELANQYRAEKSAVYPDRLIANDPIEW